MTAKNQRKEEVMSILEDHCNVLKKQFPGSLPPVHNWPKTRDVADKAHAHVCSGTL